MLSIDLLTLRSATSCIPEPMQAAYIWGKKRFKLDKISDFSITMYENKCILFTKGAQKLKFKKIAEPKKKS